jgi:ubiquinone/menaquinone biosynthesis C-methylase UbiE
MNDHKPTIDTLMQLQFAMAGTRVLTEAVTMEVFTHISKGSKTAAQVAKAAAASERGMRMLLDGLCSFGLLTKDKKGYDLAPLAAEHLVKGKDGYAGHILEGGHLWNAWTHLGDSVRSGKPIQKVEEQKGAETFFPTLVRSLHVLNREPARRTAQVLKGCKNVLDVACGSGVWGIACAEADKQVKVTANDFPALLEVTREYAKKHGVADRFDYLTGDLKTADYGKDRFDAAILGNIVHSEGEKSSRALFKKMHGALRKGGKLAIVDMVPNDERTGPPFPVLFALNMLLMTETGDTYTVADYRAWLSEAGFSKVETADIGSHSPLVVGIK